MLNLFLIAAAAFGALGLVSLVWAPALKAPASSGGPAPAPLPVKLIAKNPQPERDSPGPNPVDAFRAWFCVVRPVLIASGASSEEIRQAGLDLVKHLIMEAPNDET
ncbi:hypothetical protein [Blastopirellula retiformator]|uniref:Uncharacterized protein n=1 Tax=Blastopirellula retiformator TaxID=2527970 RepID=A0A5C5V9Y8_9BACT|nr:hypothetical protein [Blastopirellula retiformator]TWT34709.1 hypothetical protein Enr8_21220 [Blastopirellula retiformator]